MSKGIITRMIFCEMLGWHTPNGCGFDGVSFTSICKRCNRPILMDSNGDWFAIGAPYEEERDNEHTLNMSMDILNEAPTVIESEDGDSND